jgi:uncharacterized protein (TIGR03435 family)
MREMVSNLLKERFGLTFHQISRAASGFDLVVVSSGHKLRPSTPESSESDAGQSSVPASLPKRDPAGYPVPLPGSTWEVMFSGSIARMTFAHCTIPCLVNKLSSAFSGFDGTAATVPIIDKTGLHGAFDFHLELEVPPRAMPPGLVAEPAANMDVRESQVSAKTMSAAIEKQLGLKLNPVKTEIVVLIVDHLERKPTPN